MEWIENKLRRLDKKGFIVLFWSIQKVRKNRNEKQ